MGSQERANSTDFRRKSRRNFLAGLGSAGAALLLPGRHALAAAAAPEAMMCVGSFGPTDSGTLHIFATSHGRCEPLFSASAALPVALAVHPFRPILYVANAITHYQYEPRGTIEAYVADPRNGVLKLLHRQPLSLSAVQPASLAIAPDGRSLLVGAFGGGAWNLLPLDPAGVPGAPSAILKQLGRGGLSPSRAHPANAVFLPEHGLAVAADYGTDRLDILSVAHAPFAAAPLAIANRMQLQDGTGPAALALHGGGKLLIAAQRLRPSLATFRISRSGELRPLDTAALDSAPTAIAIHQDTLYSAVEVSSHLSRIDRWILHPGAGTLRRMAGAQLSSGQIHSLRVAGTILWITADRGFFSAEADCLGAISEKPSLIASIPGARCMAHLRRA